ncbi:GPI mannosyltransferase 2 [Tricharina praecox]|uniref:GPI mannosyltransferase 2 n=1 Tax=Tricharina praecox TaxID=43433 RepID=UPI0022202D0E|nr:GPI mannosyltransferase 2 [Tricharina praecox]KAI5859070.1 GPI mannosyltransferase 2 [Tricharina praecox]
MCILRNKEKLSMLSPDLIQRRPYSTLLVVFACWKLILGLIAFTTPSPAYDTSTSLLLLQSNHDNASTFGVRFLKTICGSLTRWDAIFFAKIAEPGRGYWNEQEWAFGWGYTRVIAATRRVLCSFLPLDQLAHPYPEIISAVLLSNACHIASVFVLYKLAFLFSKSPQRAHVLAWVTSVLHILSPAGLFLSAPYSESLFSLLSFTGAYLYALSMKAVGSQQHMRGNSLTLCSAIVFAAASTVRSNGLLNGILFLFDFVPALLSFDLVRVVVLGVGGVLVGAGVALPQYIAWGEYCISTPPLRPWCTKLVPSIYTYVQDVYWNVGLFRYWTLSNLPLFVLAAPTLLILFASGNWVLRQSKRNTDIVFRLAISQLILAGMAIFSYHVQVITRLSSGSAVWYWWVAVKFIGEGDTMMRSSRSTEYRTLGWILRWMVMYGLIQGVLFAAFLPPA